MKTIFLKLEDNIAKVINNEPLYLNNGEAVAFIIVNEINDKDKLFYCPSKDKNYEIDNKTFILDYEQIKEVVEFNITLRTEKDVYPVHFALRDLKVNNVKVLGNTIDEHYPDVIKDLFDRLKTLTNAYLELYDEFQEFKNKGVM